MLSVVFYIAVFVIVFIIQTIAMKQKRVIIKKGLILLSFAIILALIGLRYKVGVDYEGHVDMYNAYAGQSFSTIWSNSGDIGKKIIIGLAPYVFGDVKSIFWIYGLLTLYPIYKINKNSKFKYLAYSTLVFNLTILPACLNIMRQGAAMSFALLAFDYIRHDAKWVKVVICIIIAALLHTSALLTLPFLILFFFTRKRGRSFMFWSFVLTVFESISFVSFLSDIFFRLSFSDYDYMLEVSGSAKVYSGWVLYYVVYYAMLLLIYYIYKKDKKTKAKERDETGNMLAMVVNGSVFEVVGTMTKYLSRVSYYFSMYQIILIPILLQNTSDKRARVTMKIMSIAILIALFVFRCFIQGYYGIFPYQTWIFGT